MQIIEDIDRHVDEIRAAARKVYQENRELRALLAAFAGPARLVLEELDRFAASHGIAMEPQAPASPAEDAPEPSPAGDWDGLGRPAEDVIAGWAEEIEHGVRAADIAARYGETAVRIGMLVSHWRRRKWATERIRAERDAADDDGDLRAAEEDEDFHQDEIGGTR